MGELKIHFLNVGHGDCTVIEHASKHLTVIDTSNGEDIDNEVIDAALRRLGKGRLAFSVFKSFEHSERKALNRMGAEIEPTNPIQFIGAKYPGQSIFRYIQTHPDMDHMRGITSLEKAFSFTNFWDTRNTKVCEPEAHDVEDWGTSQRLRRGKVHNFVRGDQCMYFARNEDARLGGDGIQILSPTITLTSDCDTGQDWNNMSYVLRVTHAGISVILGGDAEERAWKDIADTYGPSLKCSILKASHHGRRSGYYKPALDLMSPTIAVLSIADECQHEAYEEYAKHCKYLWSTYEKGDITLTITDKGEILYSFQRTAQAA